MNKIALLSPQLISKIAAGEVIERPASVIKECVENSLDAQATSIEIHLKDAGKQLIHIKDNGLGIEREGLEKLFFRHATSKIKNEDDLYNISSLGFRGEALYSIGAISDVALKSKTPQQSEGWEIHVRGTERISLKPAATTPQGTEIEIKELFFNTPARKKFLKSNTTEINQILNTFIPYTLLHSSVRFLLTHQNNTLIDLLPSQTLTKRIALALNLEEKFLLEKNYPQDMDDIAISLVLGDINIKRPRRDLQFLFVNGRPVQNKNISFHLNQVYRLIMPETDYPFFCVYLHVPPQNVDVNVHPTKREVKLKDEQHICSLLRNLTEEALMKQGRTKSIIEDLSIKINEKQKSTTINQGPIDNLIGHSSQKGNPVFKFPLNSSSSNDSKIVIHAENEQKTNKDEYVKKNIFDMNSRLDSNDSEKIFENNIKKDEDFYTGNKENLQTRLKGATFIGSFINKYLLFEKGHSIFLMDQHAAAERINYEKFLNQIMQGQVEVQHLLTPVTIALTPQELVSFEAIKETLEKIGFSNNQWDNSSIAIHSHPIFIKNIERAVRNLLADKNIGHCDMDKVASRACRASVMTGDKLYAEQALKLKEQLIECFDPFTCPHGRPTVVELTEDFLDKQFLR